MTDISELVVRIKADASGLDRELKKTTGAVRDASNNMGNSIGRLSGQFKALTAGLSVAAFVGFVKSASQAADRLNDLADRTGIAATTLSALSLPLQLGGSSADEFASSITRMNNAIGEAASGQSQSAARAFTDLGLSISELMQMTPEEQFNAIARALSAIDNQAEFTNKGMAIFGRQFVSLSKFIRETSGNMDDFVKKQQEAGNSLTAEELKMVGDFWDAFDTGIAKAEAGVIRLLYQIANLRSEIAKDLDFTWVKTPDGFVKVNNRDVESRISTDRPETVNKVTFKKIGTVNGDGKKNQLAEYRQSLERDLQMAGLGERDQVSLAARFKTIDAAKDQGVKATEAMIAANQELALKAYDTKKALDEETEAKRKAEDATKRFADTLKDKLSSGLTDAIFNAENAGDAFMRLGQELAMAIFERSVAQPFSNTIVDAIDGSGLGSTIGGFFGDLLPSFDVGSPNVPSDMIAQIHKGERIIPANQNNPQGLASLAGGSGAGVTVNQYFQSGVSRAELQAVLPQVAAAAHDAVFNSIQKGGSAAKIVGVR